MQGAGDGDFFRAFAVTNALELGRNHLGVVENERVAGLQEGWQVVDMVVFEHRRRIRANHQEAGMITRACGPQRDVVIRQVEVEKVYTHRYLFGSVMAGLNAKTRQGAAHRGGLRVL